jgi:hypothetical protein
MVYIVAILVQLRPELGILRQANGSSATLPGQYADFKKSPNNQGHQQFDNA